MKRLGLDNEAIGEIVAVVDIFNGTNRIANADPDLLALCPLHLSLYEKDGKTVVIMPKLSAMAEGSAGLDEAAKLEAELAAILGRALAVE